MQNMFVFVNLKGGVQGGFVAKIFFGVINYIGTILGLKTAILGDFRRFWNNVFAHNSVKKHRTEKIKIVLES